MPDGMSIAKVSEGLVEVRGLSQEPFLLTESSARKSLERIRSKRATHEAGQYQRRLSIYVEAFRLMGWAIPDDPNAPVESIPVESPADTAAQALATVVPVVKPPVEPPVEPPGARESHMCAQWQAE